MHWKRRARGWVCLCGLALVGVVATEECLYQAALSRIPTRPRKPERVSAPPSWPLLRWLSLEDAPTPRMEPFWPGSYTRGFLGAALLGEVPEKPVGYHLANIGMWRWAGELRREGHGHLKGLERIAMTVWLTRNWSVEDLLAYDAEQAFLGKGLSGMREGARVMLGADWDRLDAAGVALLIAVSEAPSRRDPWCAPERVRARRDWLLKRLREAGGLTPEETEAALRAPLGLVARPSHWPPCPFKNGGASPPRIGDKPP